MQGFNMGHYVPPDLEGIISGNKLNNKHALGARASKLKSQGILTVRFEMPFAVWCSTCPKPTIIGQGVRFNAEKKKVGNYYSTPVWSFRMKHAACGGWIEIRTDPKNTAYVIVEGGKARDYGDESDRLREGEGGVPILTQAERDRRREDAFAQLEGKAEEKAQVKDNAKRIEELYRARERDWDDPFAANKRLRASFRRERKVRKREEEASEALKDRMGLGIDLLPENEDDARRAAAIDFRNLDSGTAAGTKPLFPQPALAVSRDRAVGKKGEDLREAIKGNTRAALNPFGEVEPAKTSAPGFKPRLKHGVESTDGSQQAGVGSDPLALTAYDSASE